MLAYSRSLSYRDCTHLLTHSPRDYNYYYTYKNANVLHISTKRFTRPEHGGEFSSFHGRNKARFGELSQRQSILACAF